MATITIRNLPETTRRALKARAAKHNQSMEAEVRQILEEAVSPEVDFISDWMTSAEALRGEFPLPVRSAPRPVDLD